MQLSIQFLIKKNLDNSNYSLENNEVLNQLLLTNNFDSNDFKTKNYFSIDNVLDTIVDESNSLLVDYYLENIIEKYNITLDKVSFIYISLQDIDNLTVAENNLRFRIKINGAIVSLSQISLFNIENLVDDLSIIDYSIPEGKQGLLKIIIGQK